MGHTAGEMADGVSANFHIVNQAGAHAGNRLPDLEAMSLDAALAAAHRIHLFDTQPEKGTTLAWIDFPSLHMSGDRFESELRHTYLATQEDARYADGFMNAGTLASSILHARAHNDAKWIIPRAHKKTMENFETDPNYGRALAFVRGWLPRFIRVDTTQPPTPRARTDSIRLITSLMYSESFQLRP